MTDEITISGRVFATEMATPQVLSMTAAQELATQIADLLVIAQARGLNEQTVAARVVTFIAPLLTDKDRQIEQAAAAMTVLVAELGEVRRELEAALVDGERFRELHEQSCPRGLHDGWFVASEHPYACPWCGILEARGDVPPEVVLSGPGWPPAEKDVEGVGRPFECPVPVLAADGALQCPVHGPHPHANLSCPDCPTCRDGGA